ncbi:hypothetical protein QWT69_03395 [Sporosarcina oncorhynchi]|uniref:ABC transporter permease n=1 Tax=Sporosarcina oncorhynchi TaxID=3056444 RepID=A0ABZ0L7P0_9BACL|nr:hypothetical protein [Sporosarcina sp. T2O-4]WOV88184.1 hypothetical protein QWT69_03395 [Sporosarcina sp. T2O-4]
MVMKWNYCLFELRLLLANKKNWVLGIAFILFIPIYYLHYSSVEVKDIQVLKNEESKEYFSIFNYYPEESRDTPKGKEIYENLTEQSSLVNDQRFALWTKELDNDLYITSGLKLNELRLRVHELGNEGIHASFVIPKEEIYKEIALLSYYSERDLPLVKDPFAASNYLPVALNWMSGLLFSLFVLLIGSSMYIHDQQKKTVMGVFPVTFMQKVVTKVGLHFAQVLVFLGLGVAAGIAFVASKAGVGNFETPVLLFQNGTYIAVSTTRYLVYMFVALALITLLLLFASALFNILTENLYVSLLAILFIIVLPMICSYAGLPTRWLQPIEFIDIGKVMDGSAALRTGSDTLDFKHGLFWLTSLNIFVVALLYGKNKWTYRKRKEKPVFESGVAGK